MAYSRIYEDIYTFPVVIGGNYTAGEKRFFDPCPEIKKRKIKAISISYNSTSTFLTGALYITFKDTNNKILTQNYPAIDLNDSIYQLYQPPQTYRLRLFNYDNIDLNNSYYILSNINISGIFELFNLNFYLD